MKPSSRFETKKWLPPLAITAVAVGLWYGVFQNRGVPEKPGKTEKPGDQNAKVAHVKVAKPDALPKLPREHFDKAVLADLTLAGELYPLYVKNGLAAVQARIEPLGPGTNRASLISDFIRHFCRRPQTPEAIEEFMIWLASTGYEDDSDAFGRIEGLDLVSQLEMEDLAELLGRMKPETVNEGFLKGVAAMMMRNPDDAPAYVRALSPLGKRAQIAYSELANSQHRLGKTPTEFENLALGIGISGENLRDVAASFGYSSGPGESLAALKKDIAIFQSEEFRRGFLSSTLPEWIDNEPEMLADELDYFSPMLDPENHDQMLSQLVSGLKWKGNTDKAREVAKRIKDPVLSRTIIDWLDST